MLDAAPGGVATYLLLHPSACCCTHPPVITPCDQGDREFYAEVALLTRLRHPNLVCIMGMCDEDGTKLGAPGAAGSSGVRCQVGCSVKSGAGSRGHAGYSVRWGGGSRVVRCQMGYSIKWGAGLGRALAPVSGMTQESQKLCAVQSSCLALVKQVLLTSRIRCKASDVDVQL